MAFIPYTQYVIESRDNSHIRYLSHIFKKVAKSLCFNFHICYNCKNSKELRLKYGRLIYLAQKETLNFLLANILDLTRKCIRLTLWLAAANMDMLV